MTGQRLDLRVVEAGLAPSRSRARDLISRGLIAVNGEPCDRPGRTVSSSAVVSFKNSGAGPALVSRGGEKLNQALDHFGISAAGEIALDIGASTGGFTDVLLRRGALRVYAVDVGRGQLHPSLAADPRVIHYEGFDARELDSQIVPECPGIITADVSFISLAKAMPAPLALARPGACLVALIKPQFEAGREAVGKGGIVRDASERERAVTAVSDWFGSQSGWTVVGVIPSPITGGSGNQEYLLAARRDA